VANFISGPIKYFLRRISRIYLGIVCAREHRRQVHAPNERTVEYRFVFDTLLRLAPRSVLDVGPGNSSLPHLMSICGFVVTALDNIRDYWQGSMFNRHFHVVDGDILAPRLDRKFELITCISVLEHIEDHNLAMRNMLGLLEPGGHIALTVPYSEDRFVENVYALPGAGFGKDVSYICRVFSRKEVDAWLSSNNAALVDQEYWKVYTGELHTFGQSIFPVEKNAVSSLHHLSCLLIKKP